MKKLISLILAALLALSTLTAGFAATYTDKDTVKKVQQALNDAGYECGTPDGIAGKKTAAAITQYRTDKGLEATGAIDDALLEAMGIEPPLDFEIDSVTTGKFAVGNTFVFGRYEQDNDSSNGPEAIEWRILANNGEYALLLSQWSLDVVAYAESDMDGRSPYDKFSGDWESITWEESYVRAWLNEKFADTAFTEEERGLLQTVTVTADKNPSYSSNPGNDTQDQIFLLSIKEAEQYFENYEDARCFPTPYALSNGAFHSEKYDNATGWLLRTPGEFDYDTTCVSATGIISHAGIPHTWFDGEDEFTVRPAMVLKVSDMSLYNVDTADESPTSE